jgi:hypothetical protein
MIAIVTAVGIGAGTGEKVNVVGHDHVTADGPIIDGEGAVPDVAEDVCEFGSSEDWAAIMSARGDEKKRGAIEGFEVG